MGTSRAMEKVKYQDHSMIKKTVFLLILVLLTGCDGDKNIVIIPTKTAIPAVLTSPSPASTLLVDSSSFDASGEILASNNHGIYSVNVNSEKITVLSEDTFHLFKSVNARKKDLFYLQTTGAENEPEDLFMFDGSSQEVVRFTNDSYWDYDLSASPNGMSLAYVSDRFDQTGLENRHKVILYSRETNNENILLEGNDPFMIKWSPVDSKLAILSLPVDEKTNRSLVILDTVSKKTINSFEINDPSAFNWSPDGQFLAIGGFSPNKIAIINVETSSINLFSIPKKLIGGIAWSPDGNSILLQCYEAITNQGSSDLVLLDINTGDIKLLFNGEMHPGNYLNKFIWSPDGNYIAFITLNEYDKINIMNISTLQITKLNFSYYFLELLAWTQ